MPITDKLNGIINQIVVMAIRLVRLAAYVAGVLIASDVILGTKFGVLANASKMVGVAPLNLVVGCLITYVVIKKL